jgi:hypothetical protein
MSTSAAILSKLASATPKQKKLALTLLSFVFVASILGGFFGYNDYQTTKTLKQAVAQDQQGKFDEASDNLAKADKGIAYPGTKKAIDKAIANNKRWKEYYTWQTQAEELMNNKQYAAALELLYKINNDYPLYGEVTNMIAIAEAGGDTSVIADIDVNQTPEVAGASETTMLPTTSGPSSGQSSGGGYVSPSKPTANPKVLPPPTNPTPVPYVPPPTKYIYKGDGVTRLGEYVGGSGCIGVTYKSGGGSYTLSTFDCSIYVAPSNPRNNVYYTGINCTGSAFTIQPDYNNGDYFINGSVQYRIALSGSSSYVVSSYTRFDNGVCGNSSPAALYDNCKLVYPAVLPKASDILCGGSASCSVK